MKAAILGTLAGVLLLTFGALGWLAFHYHAKAVTEQGKVSQLQSDNDLQTATIASQSLTFNTFNQIASAAQQYATKATSTSEEKVVEYRTILKSEPTCNLPVPASVSGGLLDYAHRLRSGAVSGTVADADSAGTGSASASTLTYCQAVLWINPLLSTIDKANNQLSAIRAEDAQRTASTAKATP